MFHLDAFSSVTWDKCELLEKVGRFYFQIKNTCTTNRNRMNFVWRIRSFIININIWCVVTQMVFDVFFFVFCVHFQVGFICKTWLLDRHHIIDCQLMKCAAHTAMMRPTVLPAGSLLFYFSEVLVVWYTNARKKCVRNTLYLDKKVENV